MKHLVFVLLLCPALVLAKDYGHIRINEITSIYDGDTFRVIIDGWPGLLGDNIGVRVNGIDTPEIRGKCDQEKQLAIEARELTKATLSSAHSVTLKNMSRGKYFRIVADVYADDKNLTEVLIAAGLGVAYDGGTKIKDWCK